MRIKIGISANPNVRVYSWSNVVKTSEVAVLTPDILQTTTNPQTKLPYTAEDAEKAVLSHLKKKFETTAPSKLPNENDWFTLDYPTLRETFANVLEVDLDELCK